MFKADAAKIRSLIFAKKMTLAELSLKTGLHAATCRRLATGKNVSLKTIAIVADFFNDWEHTAARAAPLCPEVDYGYLCAAHGFGETLVGKMYCRHDFSF